MASTALPLLTPAEYLEIERVAEIKSEFYNGQMFAMPPATLEHVLITTNLIAELGNRLRRLRCCPCRVLSSAMRVKVSQTGLYTYPDATVVCSQPQLEDNRRDTLL